MLHSGRGPFHVPLDMVRSQAAGYGTSDTPTTLGRYLRDAGYATHICGKWHNDDATLRDGFASGRYVFRGGMADPYNTPAVSFEGDGPLGGYAPQNVHATDLFADGAVEFLERYQRGGLSDAADEAGAGGTGGTGGDARSRPFFLYVAFTAPHDPRRTHAQFHRRYPADEQSLPMNYREQPVDTGELHIRDELLTPQPRDPWQTRQEIGDYYAMTEHMDHAIGRIHDTLDRLGLLDDTLVIHTADHGLAVGQHGLMGKQNVFDHSVRVPLIAAGPGVAEGATRDDLVYQHDLFPTLLEVAGVADRVDDAGPHARPFRALTPALRGDANPPPSRDMIGSYYRHLHRMATDGRYKLIRTLPDESAGRAGGDQLFDTEADPWELTDLAEDAEHAGTLARMREALVRWCAEMGDPQGSVA